MSEDLGQRVGREIETVVGEKVAAAKKKVVRLHDQAKVEIPEAYGMVRGAAEAAKTTARAMHYVARVGPRGVVRESAVKVRRELAGKVERILDARVKEREYQRTLADEGLGGLADKGVEDEVWTIKKRQLRHAEWDPDKSSPSGTSWLLEGMDLKDANKAKEKAKQLVAEVGALFNSISVSPEIRNDPLKLVLIWNEFLLRTESRHGPKSVGAIGKGRPYGDIRKDVRFGPDVPADRLDNPYYSPVLNRVLFAAVKGRRDFVTEQITAEDYKKILEGIIKSRKEATSSDRVGTYYRESKIAFQNFIEFMDGPRGKRGDLAMVFGRKMQTGFGPAIFREIKRVEAEIEMKEKAESSEQERRSSLSEAQTRAAEEQISWMHAGINPMALRKPSTALEHQVEIKRLQLEQDPRKVGELFSKYRWLIEVFRRPPGDKVDSVYDGSNAKVGEDNIDDWWGGQEGVGISPDKVAMMKQLQMLGELREVMWKLHGTCPEFLAELRKLATDGSLVQLQESNETIKRWFDKEIKTGEPTGVQMENIKKLLRAGPNGNVELGIENPDGTASQYSHQLRMRKNLWTTLVGKQKSMEAAATKRAAGVGEVVTVAAAGVAMAAAGAAAAERGPGRGAKEGTPGARPETMTGAPPGQTAEVRAGSPQYQTSEGIPLKPTVDKESQPLYEELLRQGLEESAALKLVKHADEEGKPKFANYGATAVERMNNMATIMLSMSQKGVREKVWKEIERTVVFYEKNLTTDEIETMKLYLSLLAADNKYRTSTKWADYKEEFIGSNSTRLVKKGNYLAIERVFGGGWGQALQTLETTILQMDERTKKSFDDVAEDIIKGVGQIFDGEQLDPPSPLISNLAQSLQERFKDKTSALGLLKFVKIFARNQGFVAYVSEKREAMGRKPVAFMLKDTTISDKPVYEPFWDATRPWIKKDFRADKPGLGRLENRLLFLPIRGFLTKKRDDIKTPMHQIMAYAHNGNERELNSLAEKSETFSAKAEYLAKCVEKLTEENIKPRNAFGELMHAYLDSLSAMMTEKEHRARITAESKWVQEFLNDILPGEKVNLAKRDHWLQNDLNFNLKLGWTKVLPWVALQILVGSGQAEAEIHKTPQAAEGGETATDKKLAKRKSDMSNSLGKIIKSLFS